MSTHKKKIYDCPKCRGAGEIRCEGCVPGQVGGGGMLCCWRCGDTGFYRCLDCNGTGKKPPKKPGK